MSNSIDTEYLYVKLPDFKREWQTVNLVKILTIDNVSEAYDNLIKWKKESPEDYRHIINSLKYAAGVSRKDIRNERRIRKVSSFNDGGEIFEVKNGNSTLARLFIFYDENIIICTNGYWKKSSGAGQNEAINRARELRKIYECAKHS